MLGRSLVGRLSLQRFVSFATQANVGNSCVFGSRYLTDLSQPDPTEAEIRDRADKVRAEWSPAEAVERMRCDKRPQPVVLMVVPAKLLFDQDDE